LSLRLRPQIQILLSREGRRPGVCRTCRSRGTRNRGGAGGGCSGARTRTKAGNAPALESDNFSWLHPAHADAAKSRWQLSIEGSVPIVDKSSNVPRSLTDISGIAATSCRYGDPAGSRPPNQSLIMRPVASLHSAESRSLILSRRSCVVVEQPTESGTPPDATDRLVLWWKLNQFVAQSLMIPLALIMGDKLRDGPRRRAAFPQSRCPRDWRLAKRAR